MSVWVLYCGDGEWMSRLREWVGGIGWCGDGEGKVLWGCNEEVFCDD